MTRDDLVALLADAAHRHRCATSQSGGPLTLEDQQWGRMIAAVLEHVDGSLAVVNGRVHGLEKSWFIPVPPCVVVLDPHEAAPEDSVQHYVLEDLS